MTYAAGGPGYPGGQQPSTYAQTTQFAKVDDGPSKLPVYLLAAVAVLGIAAYLVSFGPVGDLGEAGTLTLVLSVIALLIAALFAIVGMLPKQANYSGVVAATTVVGFLLTIWDLVKNAGDVDWALIALVVVAALQTVVAIAALLLDAGIITPPAPRPKYDRYQQFGGGYYGQQQQFGQPPQQTGPQSFGQPQPYQPYGGYPGGPPSGGFPSQPHQTGPPTPPTGFPTYSQPPAAPKPAEQNPAEVTQEAPTQQVPAQQQSSSPSGPPPE